MALLTAVTIRGKRHAYVNEYFCRSAFTAICGRRFKKGRGLFPDQYLFNAADKHLMIIFARIAFFVHGRINKAS